MSEMEPEKNDPFAQKGVKELKRKSKSIEECEIIKSQLKLSPHKDLGEIITFWSNREN